jgi:hypothetical protein
MNKYSKPHNRDEVSGLQWKLSHLENQITGEMSDYQFQLRAEINEIKKILQEYEYGITEKPDNSTFECFGCGS